MQHERIKEIRKSKGLTQEQLAQRLGVQRAVISKYENGTISPSVETLERIAAVLQTDIAEFLYSFKSDDHSSELPTHLQTLNEVIGRLGYQIKKEHGQYYFVGMHGSYPISENELNSFQQLADNYLLFQCEQVEKQHIALSAE